MKRTIHTYHNGVLTPEEAAVVSEFPLKLVVNGRELATLIASPHDLRFLVAGFLRVNGFVRSVADFEMLSVCSDFSIASVQIKGEVPEALKPILTSGCGAGISFNLPGGIAPAGIDAGKAAKIPPADIFGLMKELAQRAEQYRQHGGIHSAAVGEHGRIIFYAEDLGRHNTMDRLAGEALLRETDLSGMIIVTSGRISSEMVAKGAALGVSAIASRTSPTSLAVKLAEEWGITLIGYVRGSRFSVYCHSERLDMAASHNVERLQG
jgi:FdhD protein